MKSQCGSQQALERSIGRWIAIRQRERRVDQKLPAATTGPSARRYLARIVPVVTLIALLGGEWALLSHAAMPS